jgi:hypothetical protein
VVLQSQEKDNATPQQQAQVVMFRAVFWVELPFKMLVDHGSTTQKTALIIILAAVRT